MREMYMYTPETPLLSCGKLGLQGCTFISYLYSKTEIVGIHNQCSQRKYSKYHFFLMKFSIFRISLYCMGQTPMAYNDSQLA